MLPQNAFFELISKYQSAKTRIWIFAGMLEAEISTVIYKHIINCHKVSIKNCWGKEVNKNQLS